SHTDAAELLAEPRRDRPVPRQPAGARGRDRRQEARGGGDRRRGLLRLERQQTQAGIYRQTLVPAVRQLEGMAEESYRAGKATILVVLDAQRNVQDVERTYQQGLLALQSAFASLEEAVGAPLDQK